MRPSRGLVLDASVLIDLCDADRQILPLLREVYGQLFVSHAVLAEVRSLAAPECTALGLTLVEASEAQLAEAASGATSLSFADRLCLIHARDRGLTCATSDRALLNRCAREGIATVRSLRLLLDLVAAHRITPAYASDLARAISERNRFLRPWLEEFEAELRR